MSNSAAQTILFTVLPRGISVDSPTLPVSVLVSPRLTGANTLGSFPDFLHWTERLKTDGLTLTFACNNGQERATPIDTGPLRPELWSAIFNEQTLVDSYQFDDYAHRLVISYPARAALLLLKSIYQVAGVNLALPESGDRRDRQSARAFLVDLTGNFQVHWNDGEREALRNSYRAAQNERSTIASIMRQAGLSFDRFQLGGDGLPDASQIPASDAMKSLYHTVNTRFALFHHMPPAPPIKETAPAMDKVLDFHRAVTALNSYPELMRAVGLVFDVELPGDFVPLAPLKQPGTLHISQATFGWQPAIPPTPRLALSTAYLYLATEDQHRVFLTASNDGKQDDGSGEQLYGLLNLTPGDFGLAQVDIDGAMHKTIMLAESLDGSAPALHPEIFDPTNTLPSLRSAGLSLLSDDRALKLLATFQNSQTFNTQLESNQRQKDPFYIRDLVRGYRLDIWDSFTNAWHSLHRRDGTYQVGEETFSTQDEEGFTHLAVTQAAPDRRRNPPDDDLYLHESIARWNGWSLSVSRPGKHLTRHADPLRAVPPDDPTAIDDADRENFPATPFPMTTNFTVVKGSLPTLRFGRRYRIRARVVDLAGNSLSLTGPITDELARAFGLPQDPDGFAYLRYEPVAAPTLVLRDPRGVSGPGSTIDRLVIRSFNSDESLDTIAPDLMAGDRHVVPPRTTVEMGERQGMFDDDAGKLRTDPAMYTLIKDRDDEHKSQFPQQAVEGQAQPLPVVTAARIDTIPYLPDPLASGAALRNLPGTPSGTTGTASPTGTTPESVPYIPLNDANPRPGSVTQISFAGGGDWTTLQPFRLALAEGDGPPVWNAQERVLTIFLPKATNTVVPLSSYVSAENLKLMGVWQWLREYIEASSSQPERQEYRPGNFDDRIAHILQRVLEGGHWMLTPPRLLTLVHAVQQPLGHPTFVIPPLQHSLTPQGQPGVVPLQPEAMNGRTKTAFDIVTAWRQPGSVDAALIGGLRIHGASTAKVDIIAQWTDRIDDLANTLPSTVHQAAHVDELLIQNLRQGYLYTSSKAAESSSASNAAGHATGFYDPQHDLIYFAAHNDILGGPTAGGGIPARQDAAPRHHFGDTRHHRVTYTAIATSRFRDYFPPDANNPPLDFTRTSEGIVVDVPSSARPAAPRVAYVVPTFGWERQTSTNLKRSVRFGGGLRIYLERPWYSSGDAELLGVTLMSGSSNPFERDKWKPFVTQWGADPIWQSERLPVAPSTPHFPDGVAAEYNLSLEEPTPPNLQGQKGRVNVVGHEVEFDESRGLWYCDLTVSTGTSAYTPFVRLALTRYQPHALDDAKLSRVVLADFAQLTPERAVTVTADPYHPRRLRVIVSGPAPLGPIPQIDSILPPTVPVTTPTKLHVIVQQRSGTMQSDLAWKDVASSDDAPVTGAHFPVTVTTEQEDMLSRPPNIALWSGTVEFADPPQQDQYRLLIQEREYPSADYTILSRGGPTLPFFSEQPSRLIFAEIVALDGALIAVPPPPTSGETAGTEGGTEPITAPVPSEPPWDPFGDAPLADVFDYALLPQLQRVHNPHAVDPHVKLAQSMLNTAGAIPPLTVNGNFGPETEAAVRTFQETHFLEGDGMIGTPTWFALALASPFPALESGMQGPPVAVAQQLLNLAGASPRLVMDAIFGKKTQAAFADFQREQGLATGDVIDPAAWLALLQVPDQVAPTGTMRLVFTYDSDWWQAGEPPVRFVSREDISQAPPPSDTLSSLDGYAGFWCEWQDARGEPIHRQIGLNPIQLFAEGPSDDPNQSFTQDTLAHPKGSFALILPILPRAQTLALFSSPLDAERTSEAATLIASFDITQLQGGIA